MNWYINCLYISQLSNAFVKNVKIISEIKYIKDNAKSTEVQEILRFRLSLKFVVT